MAHAKYCPAEVDFDRANAYSAFIFLTISLYSAPLLGFTLLQTCDAIGAIFGPGAKLLRPAPAACNPNFAEHDDALRSTVRTAVFELQKTLQLARTFHSIPLCNLPRPHSATRKAKVGVRSCESSVHPGYFDADESRLGHRRITLLNEAFNGEVLDSELPPMERLNPLVAATSMEPGAVVEHFPQ
jgi:hypothetical protein